MCSVDAPEPQVVEVDKPAFVRNPYLDELDNDARAADALRRGRSSLVIPTASGQVGFSGRGGATGATPGGVPNGNSRGPNRSGPMGGGVTPGVNPNPAGSGGRTRGPNRTRAHLR